MLILSIIASSHHPTRMRIWNDLHAQHMYQKWLEPGRFRQNLVMTLLLANSNRSLSLYIRIVREMFMIMIWSVEEANNDIQLQCTLNWEYIDVNGTAPNMTDDADCYNYDEDMCGFHVDLGVCEDYTIKCDNDWEFF
eukprot:628033_1